jgi:hypothetical protein
VLADLKRRVAVLEAALGMDLDESDCTGEPGECSDGQCDIEGCPLANNRLMKVARLARRASEDTQFLLRFLDFHLRQGQNAKVAWERAKEQQT